MKIDTRVCQLAMAYSLKLVHQNEAVGVSAQLWRLDESLPILLDQPRFQFKVTLQVVKVRQLLYNVINGGPVTL